MSKYHAIPTYVKGHRFHSKAEGKRYNELLILEKAGEITDLEVGPSFTLVDGGRDRDGEVIRPIKYIGDFGYWEDGDHVVEDVKGRTAKLTQVFAIKAKLFKLRYKDIVFRIVRM